MLGEHALGGILSDGLENIIYSLYNHISTVDVQVNMRYNPNLDKMVDKEETTPDSHIEFLEGENNMNLI